MARSTYPPYGVFLGWVVLGSVLGGGFPLALGDAATTRLVTSLEDPGAGGCTTAECTLREAITEAQAGDTIAFAPVLFAIGPGTITLTAGELIIAKNLTITGPGRRRLKISGNGISRVINIASGVVTIKNVTISQGRSNQGGGLFNGGTLTLTQSTVSDNTADTKGGGIFSASPLIITQSTISGNRAVDGGGIYLAPGVWIHLQESTIRANTATRDGGGLYKESHSFYFHDVPTTITKSLIEANTARREGGGLYYNKSTYSSMHSLTESTIRKNTATKGGGIYSEGQLELKRSTVHRNTATAWGGGIYHKDDAITLDESTVSANMATWAGGIYHDGGVSVYVLQLWQSHVSNNSARQDGGGIYNDGTTRLTESTLSGNQARAGGGLYSGSFSPVTMTRSTVSGNTAANGGGLYSEGGNIAGSNITCLTSTISGNKATEQGGGLYIFYNGAVRLRQSTVSGNTATQRGGGVHKADDLSDITSKDTILVGNIAGTAGTADCSGPADRYGSLGANLVGTGTGCPLNTILGDIPVDPAQVFTHVLGPLQDNDGPTFTHALLPGSPALNVPAVTPCAGTDQRGVLRPQGAACDIGAFELAVP